MNCFQIRFQLQVAALQHGAMAALLGAGADARAKDENDETALHKAGVLHDESHVESALFLRLKVKYDKLHSYMLKAPCFCVWS
jgi:hypothetical protein